MAVLAFEASEDEAIDRAAAAILADVKSRGDTAVLEYTNKFDRLTATSIHALEIPRAELLAALPPAQAQFESAIADAKKPETRAARLLKTIEMLTKGKKNPSDR